MHRAVYDRRFGQRRRMRLPQVCDYSVPCSSKPDMGLAPGGRMRQEIYADAYGLADWDCSQTSRCFVHIANSVMWQAITGEQPPTKPLTALQYTKAGLPWFAP
jgi:hypothetical protein